MSIISIIVSFVAGILSFLSPCVLPLVPAYISYITGNSIKEINNKESPQVFQKTILFILGFSLVFILLGLTATTISKFLYQYRNILNIISGIILIILGINLTGIIKSKWFYKSIGKIDIMNMKGNAFLIGLAFGFGWTPCVGTVLAGILVYASNMNTIFQGTILLIVYSLGLALPFIITSIFLDKLMKFKNIASKYGNVISIISGILITLIGVLICTGKLTILNQYFNI